MRIERSRQCDDRLSCMRRIRVHIACRIELVPSKDHVDRSSVRLCSTRARTGLASVLTNPRNDNAAEVRGVVYSTRSCVSNYFDTDFLNMRSIFSFVASQQAWLA